MLCTANSYSRSHNMQKRSAPSYCCAPPQKLQPKPLPMPSLALPPLALPPLPNIPAAAAAQPLPRPLPRPLPPLPPLPRIPPRPPLPPGPPLPPLPPLPPPAACVLCAGACEGLVTWVHAHAAVSSQLGQHHLCSCREIGEHWPHESVTQPHFAEQTNSTFTRMMADKAG